MADKIKLTPGELQAQSGEMKTLEAEYSTLFSNVSNDLKSVNANWSPNLSHNFTGKINSAQKSFSQITTELMNGAKVADTCAVTFESVDSQLAKLYSSDGNQGASGSGGTAGFRGDGKEKINQFDVLDGKWIDKAFEDLPKSVREHLKKLYTKLIKKSGLNTANLAKVFRKMNDGEYLDALKEVVKIATKKEGFFKGLVPKFYTNVVFGMVEEYQKFCEKPTVANFFSIGWAGTVGAVMETTGDAAYDFTKFIPGVSEWYDKHGVENVGDAFNVAYTESIRTVYGDSVADYCNSYYAKNNGLFHGLINGGNEIINEVKETSEKVGGIWELWKKGAESVKDSKIVNYWKSGWNSMFN